MKKKLISTILAVSVVFSSLAVTASASEVDDISGLQSIGEIGFEFTPSAKTVYPTADQELLAAEDLDALADIVWARFIADSDNLSQDAIDSVLSIMDDYSDTVTNNGISTYDSYEISNATVVAYICAQDGVSVSNLATANSLGSDASSLAANKYSDGGGLQDSYRHFIWNHMMTDEISKSVARTVGVDYEWATIVLPYARDKYDTLLNTYLTSGTMDAFTALAAAYSGALSYSYTLRDSLISVCQASKSNFSKYFDNAAVRDLWNNCYGRAYADNYSYTYSTAFAVANSNGELINSDSSVTSSHISSVWSWDWYTP